LQRDVSCSMYSRPEGFCSTFDLAAKSMSAKRLTCGVEYKKKMGISVSACHNSPGEAGGEIVWASLNEEELFGEEQKARSFA
jgi:hypothetical protein